jgi:hypothetical protein
VRFSADSMGGGGGLAGTVLVIPALLLGGLFLGWTNLRPNFGWFCTERGRTSGKFVFLVFSDKDSFVSKGKNVSNGEIIKGPNFFLRGQIFPANWPEKSAKSWQHWLCTVCTVGGGGAHLPNRFCLSTVYILRQESVIKYVAVFKVIAGSNLCLLTALCFLRMLL